MVLNSDIIRKIIFIDPTLGNSLIQSCKYFKQAILEHKNCVNYLAGYYLNKWEYLIREQLLRYFKPNKRRLYEHGGIIVGAPPYNENLHITLNYILLTKKYENYGAPAIEPQKLEIGWNIAGFLFTEYRDIAWNDVSRLNRSCQDALSKIKRYGKKYVSCISRFYNKHITDIEAPLLDILENLSFINNLYKKKEASHDLEVKSKNDIQLSTENLESNISNIYREQRSTVFPLLGVVLLLEIITAICILGLYYGWLTFSSWKYVIACAMGAKITILALI